MITPLRWCRSLRLSPRQRRRRRGAMLILILVLLVGFMVAVTFSVDLAYMHLTRAELRTATDAGAKAAAGTLADTLNIPRAIERGREITAANTVGGQPLIVAATDFEFGNSWQTAGGAFQFELNDPPLNSVRLQGRRTADSPSGPIPLFFGQLLGVRTFEPQLSATATYIERDVVLVVDRSGSMEGQKFADLQVAIDVFTATLGETPVMEQVGLASYSSEATQDVTITANLTQISAAMAGLSANGRTSISRGIDAGDAIMQTGRSAQFVERTMIVMTDGRHNTGPEPRGPAARVADLGVTIHTITFGANADLDRMQDVAMIGHGRHFHADNGLQLRDVYREIALTLSTMMTE